MEVMRRDVTNVLVWMIDQVSVGQAFDVAEMVGIDNDLPIVARVEQGEHGALISGGGIEGTRAA